MQGEDTPLLYCGREGVYTCHIKGTKVDHVEGFRVVSECVLTTYYCMWLRSVTVYVQGNGDRCIVEYICVIYADVGSQMHADKLESLVRSPEHAVDSHEPKTKFAFYGKVCHDNCHLYLLQYYSVL